MNIGTLTLEKLMGEILFYKYELIRLLGCGGMSRVYLARDLHLNRLVAVKESAEEFPFEEIALLKELEHQGLPGIYDCFEQEEKIYIVMEYVEGMSLRQYLSRYGALKEQQAVKWAVELCRILGYLHTRHPAVIYRDLKPENIMIRRDGALKLIDLGGALRYSCGSKRQTLCAGTFGYCPPEQWKETEGDVTWDVYGTGAVLHEMLTGANPSRPPYKRLPIEAYNKGYCSTLEKIIQKCTKEKPCDRYQSAAELENALLHYHKTGIWIRGKNIAKRISVLLTGMLGVLCGLLPLWEGVPANQIPFPYLVKPLFFMLLSWFLYLIFYRINHQRLPGSGGQTCADRNILRRQEKNIWLTEKKFSGLFGLFLFVFGGVFMAAFLGAPLQPVQAKSGEESLWVEMRDDQGRKMLLKEGAVYAADECVRFELPAGRLPNKELALRLVAEGEDGKRYCSRVFLIRAER